MSNPYTSSEYLRMLVPERRVIRLRRIGIFSTGLLCSVVGSIYGFLSAGCLALTTALGVNLNDAGSGILAGFGVLLFLTGPVIYGIFGFFAGALNAMLYNVIAGITGGLRVELAQD